MRLITSLPEYILIGSISFLPFISHKYKNLYRDLSLSCHDYITYRFRCIKITSTAIRNIWHFPKNPIPLCFSNGELRLSAQVSVSVRHFIRVRPADNEPTSPDGGIGRRAGLKHQWSNPCRFDPGSGYHLNRKSLIFKDLRFFFWFLHHGGST